MVVGICLLANSCAKPTGPFLTVGDVRVNVEIAETPTARQQGLSNRASLDQNSGMLFIFDEQSVQTFWMKNTLISLDFIWIRDGKVVDITEYVPTEPGVSDDLLKRYSPKEAVDWVLEVNAGWVDRNEVEIGDLVVLTR